MRGIFSNLILLAAFNLILSLMLSERESERIMKDNIMTAMEEQQDTLVLLNAENELWRTAELSGKNSLDLTRSLYAWRSAFPGVRLALAGTCAKQEPTPLELSIRIIPVPLSNKTTTSWASGCLNERLVLSLGNQTRTLYLGGDSGFGEERNWTYGVG